MIVSAVRFRDYSTEPHAFVLKVTFSLRQQPLTGLGAEAGQGLEGLAAEENFELDPR